MEVKTVKNCRTYHDVITKPFTLEELKAKKSTVVSAKVSIPLSDLIWNDQEWLNDEVSERITGSIAGLTEISFEVFGREGKDNVILKVTGDVADFLADEEEIED